MKTASLGLLAAAGFAITANGQMSKVARRVRVRALKGGSKPGKAEGYEPIAMEVASGSTSQVNPVAADNLEFGEFGDDSSLSLSMGNDPNFVLAGDSNALASSEGRGKVGKSEFSDGSEGSGKAGKSAAPAQLETVEAENLELSDDSSQVWTCSWADGRKAAPPDDFLASGLGEWASGWDAGDVVAFDSSISMGDFDGSVPPPAPLPTSSPVAETTTTSITTSTTAKPCPCPFAFLCPDICY